MKKILLLIFFTSIQVNVFSKDSECGCDPRADLSIRQLIEADLIFKGHVINKRTEYFPGLGYSYVATFFIDELIRGNTEFETVDIEYGYGSDYCSLYFQPMEAYLILTQESNDIPYFQTNYCSGNRRTKNLSKRDNRLLFDFQNGKRELEWRNSSHKIYAKGRVSQRKPVGLWQYLRWEGEVMESGLFLEGKKEGDWITFFHPISICIELDLPIEKRTCDLSQMISPHPKGWVSSLVPYRKGKIHGIVLTFKESGCITRESIFENGLLIKTITY
jgi:hypothetical protein